MTEENKPNMDYINMLKESANKTGSIICMGLDPVEEAIPIEGSFRKKVVNFHEKVFDRMLKEGVSPGAFKPNQGFYEVHDDQPIESYEGSKALSDVMFLIMEKFPDVPIILDYKKGDIAKSSENYAKVGVNWKADALTVSPYMGTDSVMPFVKTGKGIYVLDRTSNSGGADFQNLRTIKDEKVLMEKLEGIIRWAAGKHDTPINIKDVMSNQVERLIHNQAPQLYEVVAEKIVEWSKEYRGVGAVFGATVPEELIHMAPFFAKNNTSLLIPGVGGQGGSLEQVLHTLRLENYPMYLARINSSSGITHPWKTADKAPKEYDVAVANNLRELNTQINYKAT